MRKYYPPKECSRNDKGGKLIGTNIWYRKLDKRDTISDLAERIRYEKYPDHARYLEERKGKRCKNFMSFHRIEAF